MVLYSMNCTEWTNYKCCMEWVSHVALHYHVSVVVPSELATVAAQHYHVCCSAEWISYSSCTEWVSCSPTLSCPCIVVQSELAISCQCIVQSELAGSCLCIFVQSELARSCQCIVLSELARSCLWIFVQSELAISCQCIVQSELARSCLCIFVQSELAISCLCVVQSELARVLLSMGCVGMALDIYERLQLWEDAIACYQRLGKREKVFSFFFSFYSLPVGEKVFVGGLVLKELDLTEQVLSKG